MKGLDKVKVLTDISLYFQRSIKIRGKLVFLFSIWILSDLNSIIIPGLDIRNLKHFHAHTTTLRLLAGVELFLRPEGSFADSVDVLGAGPLSLFPPLFPVSASYLLLKPLRLGLHFDPGFFWNSCEMLKSLLLLLLQFPVKFFF